MQLSSTNFLIKTLQANIECVEETDGVDQKHPGAIEFKQRLRECIARLEDPVFSARTDIDQNELG